jgi:periplasmic divalent cation tolerance protein
MTPIAVVTTVATQAQARALAQALVQRRLAACAQISQIESVYRWQGQVQHEPECRIVIKTTRERYAQVESAIRELHGYELPAIHAVAFEAIYAPYGEWIVQACEPEREPTN